MKHFAAVDVIEFTKGRSWLANRPPAREDWTADGAEAVEWFGERQGEFAQSVTKARLTGIT